MSPQKEQQDKVDEILDLLKESMDKRGAYDKLHEEQHDYLKVMIDEHMARKETWLIIKRKLLSGGAWSITVAIGSALIFTAKSILSGAP